MHGVEYMIEISSKSNEKLKSLMELTGSKKARDSKGLVLIDGGKLCMDAVNTGHSLLELWITETAAEKYNDEFSFLSSSAKETFIVKDFAAERISQLKSPQGIWGIFECPGWSETESFRGFRRVLGICGVQNPENAGAMIRTAAALGFDGAILSEDCSDIWSPRAIRAGALSQMNIAVSKTSDFAYTVKQFNDMGFETYAAALKENAESVESAPKDGKIMLIIGNEGHGLPEEVIEECSRSIYLPMYNNVESLNANAAAAIMIWEFK